MTNEISFEALKKVFNSPTQGLCKVTDKEAALSDINSKTSCCWGAGREIKIDGKPTGWIHLAAPSPNRGFRTYFVCKASLIA